MPNISRIQSRRNATNSTEFGGGGVSDAGRGCLGALRQQEIVPLAQSTGHRKGRLGFCQAVQKRLGTFAAGQPADTDTGGLGQCDEPFTARFRFAAQPLAERGRRHARRSRQPIRARPLAQNGLQPGNECGSLSGG